MYYLLHYSLRAKKEIHNWKTAAEILLKQIASLFSTLKQFPFMAGAFYFPSSVPLPADYFLERQSVILDGEWLLRQYFSSFSP